MSRRILFFTAVSLGLVLLMLAFTQPGEALKAVPLTPIEQLGKSLFFDENLSKNGNQSCATWCLNCKAQETIVLDRDGRGRVCFALFHNAS
jgi:cytochrome c peroxidase